MFRKPLLSSLLVLALQAPLFPRAHTTTQDVAAVFASFRPFQEDDPEFLEAFDRNVEILREQGYATDRPTIRFRSENGSFVELFYWASPDAVHDAHFDPVVQEVWSVLCDTSSSAVTMSSIPETSELAPTFRTMGTLDFRISLQRLVASSPAGTALVEAILRQRWNTLRELNFVTDRPPLILRSYSHRSSLIHIFEWTSTASIQAAQNHPAIQAFNSELQKVSRLAPPSELEDLQGRFPHFQALLPAKSPCDTHCDQLKLSFSPDLLRVRATATARDDSMDLIQYTFLVSDLHIPVGVVGPQPENEAEFDLPPGEYSITVSVDDGSTCDRPAENYFCTALITVTGPDERQIPGDCNRDNQLDISDPICLLGFLFFGSPAELPCGDGKITHRANIDLMDFNADRDLNITDGIGLLQYLFIGGPPHPLGSDCAPIAGCINVCDPSAALDRP